MAEQIFEVLTALPNGHRTVHRVLATNLTTAIAEVTARLDSGAVVIDSGLGPLGSDPAA